MTPPSRRSFTRLLGALGASSLVAVETACEAPGQAPDAHAEIRALLKAHGAAAFFQDADRLAELAAAVERTNTRVAALRRFQIPADVSPAVTFRRD
jgi:hypothetical protein